MILGRSCVKFAHYTYTSYNMEVIRNQIGIDQKLYRTKPSGFSSKRYEVGFGGKVTGVSEETIFPVSFKVFEITDISKDPNYPSIVKCRTFADNGKELESPVWLDSNIFQNDDWAEDKRNGRMLTEERASELLDSASSIELRSTDTSRNVRALMIEAVEIKGDEAIQLKDNLAFHILLAKGEADSRKKDIALSNKEGADKLIAIGREMIGKALCVSPEVEEKLLRAIQELESKQ